MIHDALRGLSALLSIHSQMYMLFGVLIGLVFGAIPGLNGPIALALFTPLTYKMNPAIAFSFLIGAYAAVSFGGSVSAILINVPGTGQNVATCFDGYAMSQRGEAGRALSASATASALGAVFGVAVLIGFLPIMRKVVVLFGPPESFMLCLFGITAIASVGGGSLVKGLIAGGFGLLLSFVGFEPVTGELRYTFGSLYLWDGIDLTTALIGLFAIAESIDLFVKGGTIARAEFKDAWRGVIQGIKDVFHHWALFLRSCVIGVIVGIMPGVGAAVGNVVAYAHAVQSSRERSRFGEGAVEGVIAPEAANNAKEGGALIPTIAFGIPGSSAMAILLGAFLLHGFVPGPQMLTKNADFVFLLAFTLLLGNLISSVTGLVAAGWLARVAVVRVSLLAPVVTVISLVGAFGVNGSMGDVFAACVFGLLGYGMKRLGYSRAATTIGLVLGTIAERNYHLSMQIFGYRFLTRPITLFLAVMTVLAILVSVVGARKGVEQVEA